MRIVQCSYCRGPSSLVTGRKIYPHRPDLFEQLFYLCAPCDAYVGCHKGTDKPLGRLANGALRSAKMRAHAAFDPLWKTGAFTRSRAYELLAQKLNIPKSDCHIGMFDVETCRQVAMVAKTIWGSPLE